VGTPPQFPAGLLPAVKKPGVTSDRRKPTLLTWAGLIMNTLARLLLVLHCVAYANGYAQDADGSSAVQLFDGRSLTGWEFDPEHWRVEQGAIVGEIPPGQQLNRNTWMIWRGGELRDFELRLQFRLTGAAAANSGIQIRCQAQDPGHVSGYQADLDMGATWLGRIYDEHGRALLVERGQRVFIDAAGKRRSQTFAPANMYATIFRESEWNDYRIVGIGSRIAVFINGTLFSELVDEQTEEQDLSGALALQLHSGPETRVEFRNIELEPLQADDDRLGQFALHPDPREADDSTNAAGTLPEDAAGDALNLDFESGDLSDWTATGTAFDGQPVQQDTIGQRWSGQVSNKQGRYFVGGFELSRSDAAQGTLTSRMFKVSQPFASFLIGGGRTSATRVDIVAQSDADDAAELEVIATASGDQREQMQRVVIDLRKHQGRQIAVRLVDESSGGWGHLNFDDFRFHEERPAFADAAAGPLFNPLLQHLVPAPNPQPVTGDTLARMSVPPGFEVDLIAAEPLLHQPMAFTFDARGRLWVVEGHCYPTKRPEGAGLDKVLIFEDVDKDGAFESRKVFIEGLNLVSGMQVGFGGVWIGAAPQLLFIPDRNHDDIPDGDPVVLLDGFGYADTHETINSLVWGPDCWLYGNQGVFNESHVGKPGADKDDRVRLAAGVWRYHPVRHEFEVFAHGGSNQWGLDFDDFGQLFMTHCRSHWGGGATTHVIQGAHYWNQVNSGYAPFISNRPVAGVADLRNFMLASARYGHGEGGAGKPGSRALYGGHSHVGTMIYLGDNWPAEYRNHLFTHNLHGHRMNHQINQRDGGGFNTVHAGFDVFHCADPQYIGVDLQCGPDGAVYFSDWYDPRHCHSPHTELWQRGNGRMYRMRYAGFQPADVNYTTSTDLQLVQAQLHANEWHVRMARLELAERAARQPVAVAAVRQLRELVQSHPEPQRRLRALWCLHAVNAFDADVARLALNDDDEYLRAWAIQLLAETDLIVEREALIRNTLRNETSPLVKLYLVSAAGRLPVATGWEIVETLARDSTIVRERNLPLLLWQTIGQLVPTDVDRADRLIDSSEVPLVRHAMCWYLPQVSDAGRELLIRRLEQASGADRLRTLRLVAAGLAGSRNLNQPRSWARLASRLYEDDSTRQPARLLGAAFGDKTLYAEMRRILSDDESELPSLQQAVAVLSSGTDPENLPVLLRRLDTPALRLAILQQLGRYDDPAVAEALLTRLPDLTGDEEEAAMETLCSRTGSANALLDSISEGRVEKDRLTGFYARQMASLGSPSVVERLEQQWGRLSQTSAERQAAIADLVTTYQQAPLWAYDRNAGAAHFKKLCATCHMDGQLSQRIGPRLEGTGAKGIEYIVENILDPNAVVGKDFQARNILTADGLVITGVIIDESDSAVTVRTATDTKVIANGDIDEIIVSSNSFMPEGLLKQLTERERIELLMYLMSLK
jgi:putative membrane-bound dehydrogenase-like protein